jgi:predicted methyltransferase
MLNIHYCQTCAKKVLEHSHFALFVYQQICDHFLQKNDFWEIFDINDVSSNDIFDVLSFLEERKFIITTESNIDTLKIKPNGVKILNLLTNKKHVYNYSKKKKPQYCEYEICVKDGIHD